jgi:hypothetical protein
MQVPCGIVCMDVRYSPYINPVPVTLSAISFICSCRQTNIHMHYHKLSLTCSYAEHAQGPSYLRARQAGRSSVACGGAGGYNDGEGAGEAGELRASHMSAVRECVVRPHILPESSQRRGSTCLPICSPCAGEQAHTRRLQAAPRAFPAPATPSCPPGAPRMPRARVMR